MKKITESRKAFLPLDYSYSFVASSFSYLLALLARLWALEKDPKVQRVPHGSLICDIPLFGLPWVTPEMQRWPCTPEIWEPPPSCFPNAVPLRPSCHLTSACGHTRTWISHWDHSSIAQGNIFWKESPLAFILRLKISPNMIADRSYCRKKCFFENTYPGDVGLYRIL